MFFSSDVSTRTRTLMNTALSELLPSVLPLPVSSECSITQLHILELAGIQTDHPMALCGCAYEERKGVKGGGGACMSAVTDIPRDVMRALRVLV